MGLGVGVGCELDPHLLFFSPSTYHHPATKKANKVKVLNFICSIILLSLALTVYFFFF